MRGVDTFSMLLDLRMNERIQYSMQSMFQDLKHEI